jgi:3-oxoacyl-[acyl-carrier protein] reductase
MDLGLDDKTALVTGGGGRIGSTDCRILAAEGATVIVLDVDRDRIDPVVDDIRADGSAIPVECDLTRRDDVDQALDRIRDEAGPVDVLVNNAGITDARGQVKDYDDDTWDRDMAVNLTGTYNITRAVFPRMCERGWGRVVTMSSMAGIGGGFGQLSYATTKSGLVGFGKTLALEGARHGVTSNVIAPNIVVSDLAEMSIDELEAHNEYYARIAKATPMRSLGREADVANLTAYLSSEQAGYVTGQVIGVTGGIDLFTF